MLKKDLGPEAKKAYCKPAITKNEPLVDITFSTPTATGTAAATATGTATATTTGTATLTGVGGAPGTLITKPDFGPGGGTDFGPGLDGGLGGGYDDAGTLVGTGTIITGSGGSPGTVL